jgi:RNA polymerase sigma factor (sigma-70 family)
MRLRQDLIERFSMFLQFDGDRFSHWLTDPKLKRSMQNCLNQSPTQENSDIFWSLYWHRLWQTHRHRLSVDHLTAYLQETCYWAAYGLVKNLPGKYSIADFFQTAIAQIYAILKGFNPEFSINLKSYAKLAFRNAIKKRLYQQQEMDISTDWSLLHRLSQKRLIEALSYKGVDRQMVACYVLAWKCFRELSAPIDAQTSHKLGRPDTATWQAISQLYNAQRLHLDAAGPVCRPEILEQWLLFCAQAVRSLQYPPRISVDAELAIGNLDALLNPDQNSPLDAAILQEEMAAREGKLAQIQLVIAEAIHQLDSQAQTLLQAYYQQGLTQQQLAQQFGLKQYTISRQLSRIRQHLLLALAEWSQQTRHSSLTSELLNDMNQALEEWLSIYPYDSDLTLPPDPNYVL